MKTVFKIREGLLRHIKNDLRREHGFASERVGFISVRAMSTATALVLISVEYHRVADEDYVNDPTVGAMMGQEAIRKALDLALLGGVGIFHVHMHCNKGTPRFSKVDRREQLKFVPDFFKVCAELPHGAVVCSRDRMAGNVWVGPDTFFPISEFLIVGSKLSIDVPSPPIGDTVLNTDPNT
jgi:hypothetical protein